MRALAKTALRVLSRPVLRVLLPVLEDLRHMSAYLVLSARLNHPLPTSVVVMGSLEVRGTGNVQCGHDLLLYPDLYWETVEDGAIEIGDDVVMSRGVHVVSHASIRIGSGSMIGEYCSIRDANHVRDTDGAMRNGAHSASPINLGKNVWIGRGSIILPGVSIGDNATVGANSVVTRDVPAGSTVVGAPAAAIRSSGLRALVTQTSNQRLDVTYPPPLPLATTPQANS